MCIYLHIYIYNFIKIFLKTNMTGFVKCPHQIYSIREVRKIYPFYLQSGFTVFKALPYFSSHLISRMLKDQQGRDYTFRK